MMKNKDYLRGIMMKKAMYCRFLLLAFVLLPSVRLAAQDKRDSLTNVVVESIKAKPAAGEGTITIEQDTLIGWVLNKHAWLNKSDNKLSGWRVQIYTSSGKEARDEANEVRNKFLNAYSQHKAYLIYQPPFFKIRVGDFRSKQDAFALYKELTKQYPVSYLVPDKISYPSLD